MSLIQFLRKHFPFFCHNIVFCIVGAGVAEATSEWPLITLKGGPMRFTLRRYFAFFAVFSFAACRGGIDLTVSKHGLTQIEPPSGSRFDLSKEIIVKACANQRIKTVTALAESSLQGRPAQISVNAEGCALLNFGFGTGVQTSLTVSGLVLESGSVVSNYLDSAYNLIPLETTPIIDKAERPIFIAPDPAIEAQSLNVPAKITWRAVYGAVKYYIEVRRDNPLFNTGNNEVSEHTVTPLLTFSGSPEYIYFVRVRAVFADGDQGPFSESGVFRLGAVAINNMDPFESFIRLHGFGVQNTITVAGERSAEVFIDDAPTGTTFSYPSTIYSDAARISQVENQDYANAQIFSTRFRVMDTRYASRVYLDKTYLLNQQAYGTDLAVNQNNKNLAVAIEAGSIVSPACFVGRLRNNQVISYAPNNSGASMVANGLTIAAGDTFVADDTISEVTLIAAEGSKTETKNELVGYRRVSATCIMWVWAGWWPPVPLPVPYDCSFDEGVYANITYTTVVRFAVTAQRTTEK